MNKKNITIHKTPRLDPNEKAANALWYIADFGWLRATELGRLIHPGDKHSRKYGEAYLRKLSSLKLVIPRLLPGRGAGKAYVLSSKGAAWLNAFHESNIYKTGKNWGSTKNGMWIAPQNWQHELIATGVLTLFSEKYACEIYQEHVLRNEYPSAPKHPDGLITIRKSDNPFSIWLEVENARKSGRNITNLVIALIKAARGTPIVGYDIVQDAPIKQAIVAINPEAIDERGYKLNHFFRISQCIGKMDLIAPVDIYICWLKMKGVGVSDFTIEAKTFNP